MRVKMNAGAIRLLLPPARYADLVDMEKASYCIVSRGPWPAAGAAEGIEILWEDESDLPHAIHPSAESFDLLPGDPGEGHTWTLAVWIERDGLPVKAIEKLAYWRRVSRLPCLKPL